MIDVRSIVVWSFIQGSASYISKIVFVYFLFYFIFQKGLYHWHDRIEL